MRIGISVNSSHPGVDARTGARWMIERVKAASDAGLDSLFVGDHHNTGANYYQNTPMLGRLLAEWQGPTAGALFLLPLWHPVLLAEQVATLASIHSGRFVLQCGMGQGRKQSNKTTALAFHRQRWPRYHRNLSTYGSVHQHQWPLSEQDNWVTVGWEHLH